MHISIYNFLVTMNALFTHANFSLRFLASEGFSFLKKTQVTQGQVRINDCDSPILLLRTSHNLIGCMYCIGILNIDSFLSSRIAKKSLSQPKNRLHRILCHYKQLFPKLFTQHLKSLMLGIHYIFNVVIWPLNDSTSTVHLAYTILLIAGVTWQ